MLPDTDIPECESSSPEQPIIGDEPSDAASIRSQSENDADRLSENRTVTTRQLGAFAVKPSRVESAMMRVLELADVRRDRRSEMTENRTHARSGSTPDDNSCRAESVQKERRTFQRYESKSTITSTRPEQSDALNPQQLSWMNYSNRSKGSIRDISMSCVAFLSEEPLITGEKVRLHLFNRLIEKSVDKMSTVERSSEQDDGRWEIVCRFDRQLNFEQLRDIGSNRLS